MQMSQEILKRRVIGIWKFIDALMETNVTHSVDLNFWK